MNGGKWTDDQIEFLKNNYNVILARECATALNKGIHTVKFKAKKLGLKKSINTHQVHNIEDFNNIIRPEIAYFLGFLWADGWISKTGRNSNDVHTEIVSDDADDLKNLFQSIGNLGISIRSRPKRRSQTHYWITDERLATYLRENNYENKTGGSPEQILSKIPDDLKEFWFRGFWDGDGNWYKKGTNKITTISGCYEQDWKFIEDLFIRLNVKYQIKQIIVNEKSKHSFIRSWGIDSMNKIAKFLYCKNINIGLKRKMEKAIQFIIPQELM